MIQGTMPKLQEPQKKKRRTMTDAWNAYVAENPPSGGCKNLKIKSGSHVKTLAARWRVKTPAAKKKYVDLAASKRAQLRAEAADRR